MVVKLEDVCERSSSDLKQSDIEGKAGRYPVYGAAGYIGNVDFFHQEAPYVAVVKDGAGIGRTVLLPANSSVIGTMQYLLPKSNVMAEYLYYAVQHMHLEKYFTGATIPHIYFKDYRREEFNLSTLDKQKQIVDILGTVDKVIKEKEQELELLDYLIKSRFVEMFGDPVHNPKGWPMVELGALTGIGSSKRIFEREYVDSGIPFYRTKEIVELSKGNTITTELYISETRFAEIKEQYGTPKTNDLLISAVGTIGAIWIVDGKNDFYFKDGNLIRVDASEKFNSIYIKQLLENLLVEYKKQMSAGTAYAALTISGLAKMCVYDVPIELQNQFAAFVHQVDKLKFNNAA